jgi:SAM-dependent methyltransferase
LSVLFSTKSDKAGEGFAFEGSGESAPKPILPQQSNRVSELSQLSDESRKAHWENVYATRAENEVSWFEDNPALSIELIGLARPAPQSAIVDIGGGASRLVDHLVARGFLHVSVLDISRASLEVAKKRLGDRATLVQWIAADVTEWSPAQTFDIWHDRAAFHFLVDPADRAAYIACTKKAVARGGYVIIGTFAKDGPEKCSGLPVSRYDAEGLADQLGADFESLAGRRHHHTTPWNSEQRFQFCVFRRG